MRAQGWWLACRGAWAARRWERFRRSASPPSKAWRRPASCIPPAGLPGRGSHPVRPLHARDDPERRCAPEVQVSPQRAGDCGVHAGGTFAAAERIAASSRRCSRQAIQATREAGNSLGGRANRSNTSSSLALRIACRWTAASCFALWAADNLHGRGGRYLPGIRPPAPPRKPAGEHLGLAAHRRRRERERLYRQGRGGSECAHFLDASGGGRVEGLAREHAAGDERHQPEAV